MQIKPRCATWHKLKICNSIGASSRWYSFGARWPSTVLGKLVQCSNILCPVRCKNLPKYVYSWNDSFSMLEKNLSMISCSLCQWKWRFTIVPTYSTCCTNVPWVWDRLVQILSDDPKGFQRSRLGNKYIYTPSNDAPTVTVLIHTNYNFLS